MKKYDSFLFGYGLTINIFKNIEMNYNISDPCKKYLNFNNYLRDILFKPDHSSVWRNLSTLFDENSNASIKYRIQTREKLKDSYEEICLYGFERWVGKYLFDKKKKVDTELIIFVYILYNHWADLLFDGIFNRKTIQMYLKKISNEISNKVNSKQIYTTNYDIYFDEYLNIQHIHGKFILPLNKISQIMTLLPWDKSKYEYAYLFGGGGIEKTHRLNDIIKLKIPEYNTDFFTDESLNMGNILIYGLSFARTEYLTDEFLLKNPEYITNYHFMSVDGHILKLLNQKYNENKLSSIKLTYYNKDEYYYLKNVLKNTELLEITDIVHVDEVNILSK